jgi:hypothetical protein
MLVSQFSGDMKNAVYRLLFLAGYSTVVYPSCVAPQEGTCVVSTHLCQAPKVRQWPGAFDHASGTAMILFSRYERWLSDSESLRGD